MAKCERIIAFAMLFFLVGTFSAQAAVNEQNDWLNKASKVRLDDQTGKVSFIMFGEADGPAASEARTILGQILELKEGESFLPYRTNSDQLGMTHTRYRQHYYNVPVLGGEYIAHFKNGRLVSMNGDYQLLPEHVTPSFSADDARDVALAHVNAQFYKWDSPAEELLKQQESGDPDATWYPAGQLEYVPEEGDFSKPFKLAWKFDINANVPLYGADVYVDVQSGAIVFEHNQIMHTDKPGQGVSKYSDTVNIVSDSVGPNQYRLRETGRGGGIHTRNLQNGNNTGNYVEFTDSNNFWNNFNADLDEVAIDAHWGMEMTYDYYFQKHNRNSYNNLGSQLISNVHYGNNYSNAFWGNSMAHFGDASGLPFTALDVVGHEISHGVVGWSAGLIYQNESGALNESFADIFGNSIEYFAKPQDFNWRIGEDMTSSGNGIRNMSNPSDFNDPDTYFGNNWVTGTFDNGGVHINSGVQNFWFYLLVNGGSGTNDNGDTYTVQAIGWDSAAAVAYRNLDVYLTASSQYKDARFGAIQAAEDLYGSCSFVTQQVMNAWHAVGVGGQFSATPAAQFAYSDSTFCRTPADVDFSDLSTGAFTYNWNFGDGNVSSAVNPSHTYYANGTYTVRLIVTGCNSSRDTVEKAAIIQIDENQPCKIKMPSNASDLYEGCSGTLWDSGGEDDDYLNNNLSRITISPTGALSVSLNFTKFDFAPTGDFVKIYDGPDNNAPLIGQYNGNTLPNGGTITSTGGSITIEESTNGFQAFPGFELNWSCAVGINDDLGRKFGLAAFPNPAKDAFRVNFELPNYMDYELSIVSIYGQELFHENGTQSGSVSRKLTGSDFAAGIYFVRLETELGTAMKKLVIE